MVAAVEDAVVLDIEIHALGEHGLRLLREIRVFEVGGVVAARRQDDIDAAAVHMIHDGLERLPVAAVVLEDVPDAILALDEVDA